MHAIKPQFFLLIFLFCLSASNATHAQTDNLTGIWEDINIPGRYISIHLKENNRLVLIDLSGIEFKGNTLQSSFHGRINTSDTTSSSILLKVLEKQNANFQQVTINRREINELSLSWCNPPENGVCGIGRYQVVIKVF